MKSTPFLRPFSLITWRFPRYNRLRSSWWSQIHLISGIIFIFPNEGDLDSLHVGLVPLSALCHHEVLRGHTNDINSAPRFAKDPLGLMSFRAWCRAPLPCKDSLLSGTSLRGSTDQPWQSIGAVGLHPRLVEPRTVLSLPDFHFLLWGYLSHLVSSYSAPYPYQGPPEQSIDGEEVLRWLLLVINQLSINPKIVEGGSVFRGLSYIHVSTIWLYWLM